MVVLGEIPENARSAWPRGLMSPSNQVISPEVLETIEAPPVFRVRLRYHLRLAVAVAAGLLPSLIGIRADSPPLQGDMVPHVRQTRATHDPLPREPFQSTAFLLRSALAQEEDNSELAHKSLHQAWVLNHANPSLAVRLAYQALELEDVKGAQAVLEETAKRCPKDHTLKIHQAVISLRYQSNPRSALGYAELAYQLAPANPRSINILTETLAELGQINRIEQLLTSCSSIPSNDPDFWVTTSESFAKNLFTEGELPHPQTLARFNAILRRSIESGLSNATYTERNADICVRSGQLPEAVLLYRRSLNLTDERPTQRRAITHHKLARTLLSLDKDADALTSASQAVALDETNPSHLELRADIHLEQKNWHLALSDLSRGASLEPESLELQIRTANLEIKLREFESASNRCRSLCESFPSAPTPKILLAIALASLGKHHDAITQLSAAENLLTESEQASIGPEILFPLGVAAEKAGLAEKAASLLKKCISQDEELSPDAANHLAFMWIETNSNLEEAGTLIRKALQANPDSPYYRDTFGWWLFKMGEPKAALDELVRALKRMPTPEQPDVHSHLAEVYWSLNDPVNTARHLKAFAEMRPDTPGLEERIETLRIANPEIR